MDDCCILRVRCNIKHYIKLLHWCAAIAGQIQSLHVPNYDNEEIVELLKFLYHRDAQQDSNDLAVQSDYYAPFQFLPQVAVVLSCFRGFQHPSH